MFHLGFNSLLGIFDWLVNWINDWIINYVVKNLFYYLDIWLGSLTYRAIIVGVGKVGDICMLLFRKFAGISDVGVNIEGQSTSGDIVMTLLQSRTVTNLFWSMILVAVVILLIATFAGVIKTEFAKDGNNNKRKVIKNAFRGLANFVVVPVICLFGVFVGNIILQAIDGATKTNETTSIAGQCLVIGGYNVNRARKSQKSGTWGKYIVKSGNENEFYWGQDRSFGSYLVGQNDSNYTNNVSKGWGNFGIFYDDDKSAVNARTAAEKIDAAFASNLILTVPDVSVSQRTINIVHVMGWYIGPITMAMIKVSGVMDPASTMVMGGEVIGGATDNNTWADLASALAGNGTFQPGWQISFSPYNIGLVAYYYDLTFSGFDYLTSAIALLYFCFVMLVTAVGLIKRLFTLSILFIISPGVCALYPLDEGKALEKWRSAFIKDTLAAYSTVVCANIFFSILPMFLSMNVFTTPSELGGLAMIPGGLQIANRFARLLIIIGALLFFKNATKQVAEIIGGADAFAEGAAPAKKLGQVAAMAAGTIATAGAAAGALAKGMGKGIGKAVANKKDLAFKNRMQKTQGDKVAQGDAAKDAGAPDSGQAQNDNSINDEANSMNQNNDQVAENPNQTASGNEGKASGGSDQGSGGNSVNGGGSEPDWHALRLADDHKRWREKHPKLAAREDNRNAKVKEKAAEKQEKAKAKEEKRIDKDANRLMKKYDDITDKDVAREIAKSTRDDVRKANKGIIKNSLAENKAGIKVKKTFGGLFEGINSIVTGKGMTFRDAFGITKKGSAKQQKSDEKAKQAAQQAAQEKKENARTEKLAQEIKSLKSDFSRNNNEISQELKNISSKLDKKK